MGRWDWWDLGGRFDAAIVGDRRPRTVRSVAKLSSGAYAGRTILANIQDRLAETLGQEPFDTLNVRTDQNIELVATLLQDSRSARETANPGALMLPPGTVENCLRWLDTWPELRPRKAFSRLGVEADAKWADIVAAAYERFEGCWAAGVAYHF